MRDVIQHNTWLSVGANTQTGSSSPDICVLYGYMVSEPSGRADAVPWPWHGSFGPGPSGIAIRSPPCPGLRPEPTTRRPLHVLVLSPAVGGLGRRFGGHVVATASRSPALYLDPKGRLVQGLHATRVRMQAATLQLGCTRVAIGAHLNLNGAKGACPYIIPILAAQSRSHVIPAIQARLPCPALPTT